MHFDFNFASIKDSRIKLKVHQNIRISLGTLMYQVVGHVMDQSINLDSTFLCVCACVELSCV